MEEVTAFAKKGGRVLGICNGFQILTEAGLLPGALLENVTRKFICKTVELKVDNVDTPFTGKYRKGEVVRMPIAHAEGNYTIDDDGLERLEKEGQVVFRYVELQVEAKDKDAARARVEDMCRKLLANTVVENFRVEIP